MLLLVLILVLIAFGLLVVALLSGSVLWAWVSVGVSVAAAAVLLVDWLQRRSAVKAGAEPDLISDPSRSADYVADIEPITEIIPIIPASGPMTGGPDGNGMAGGLAAAGFDAAAAGQRTVAIRAVQPSGSAARPSGAESDITSSSGSSSQSVTVSGADRSSALAGSGEQHGSSATVAAGSGDRAQGSSDEQATVMVDIRKGGSGGGTNTSPPVSAPVGDPAGWNATDGAGSDPASEASHAETAPPRGSPIDPPEETRDETAAALVAALDDVVIVVDEQPRYHLAGCRALVGNPVIPLPAREAVDLGFTPCGWCSPDHRLAGRHQAAAR